jgi:hypothetical protein
MYRGTSLKITVSSGGADRRGGLGADGWQEADEELSLAVPGPDTGAFAIASIRGWWRAEGRRLYPKTCSLPLEARLQMLNSACAQSSA